jgi:threonyl-tRNA synthetase
LEEEFKSVGLRVEVDDHNETMGNKIRKATQEKIPYLLVIGDKEMESQNLAVRERGSQDNKEMGKAEFVSAVLERIKAKK